MKKTDIIITVIAAFLLFTVVGHSIPILIQTLAGVLLLATVLHWKITPFKDQLSLNYKKTYYYCDKVIGILLAPASHIPKLQIGPRVQLDMSYFIIIAILSLTLIIL